MIKSSIQAHCLKGLFVTSDKVVEDITLQKGPFRKNILLIYI